MQYNVRAKGFKDFGTADDLHRPTLKQYEQWLRVVWQGDRRELRRGRYLQQQRDLQEAFKASPFYGSLQGQLLAWSAEYKDQMKADLFSRGQPEVDLKLKPWESFLSRTWRENVLKNDNWPEPPLGGWYSPDCWFERVRDVVRTRLVVRYLDGVEFLATRLARHARGLGQDSERRTHAKEDGYYAMHVVVQQSFEVQTLNFEELEERCSGVEVQLATELQRTIGELTHEYFQGRRETRPHGEEKWQWDYRAPEFTPLYLGHLLHYIEGMIMQVRENDRGSGV